MPLSSVCWEILYPTDWRIVRTWSRGPMMFGEPLSTDTGVESDGGAHEDEDGYVLHPALICPKDLPSTTRSGESASEVLLTVQESFCRGVQC